MWNIETQNGYFTDKRDTPVRLWFYGEGVGSIRPSVAAFALLMEAQLQAHDARPGWEADTIADLARHLTEERQEFDDTQAGLAGIGTEGADEANMVMMIVQQARGLDNALRQLRGE